MCDDQERWDEYGFKLKSGLPPTPSSRKESREHRSFRRDLECLGKGGGILGAVIRRNFHPREHSGDFVLPAALSIRSCSSSFLRLGFIRRCLPGQRADSQVSPEETIRFGKLRRWSLLRLSLRLELYRRLVLGLSSLFSFSSNRLG